jgi:sulfate adenylyltransferase subunit 2
MLLAESDLIPAGDGEEVRELSVRYRTVGDMTVTGAVESEASDIAAVMDETAAATVSERGQTRADDRTSEAAMEDRKREGYF